MGRGRTALVIGAGTTGLLSAAALSRHFAQVTVLERDELPTSPSWRKGSPQSPHVHVLLKRGADIMQKYLPGALDDIERPARIHAATASGARASCHRSRSR